MEKARTILLAVWFCLFAGVVPLGAAQQGQGILNQFADQRPVTCPALRTEVQRFTIVVHSPEEKEQFMIRKEMYDLIFQTWEDDRRGIVDVKKYQRIKKLANKLRGPK